MDGWEGARMKFREYGGRRGDLRCGNRIGESCLHAKDTVQWTLLHEHQLSPVVTEIQIVALGSVIKAP